MKKPAWESSEGTKIGRILENLSPGLDRVEDICRGAGELIMERFGALSKIERKGAIDLVTEADEMSERFILGELGTLFPGHFFLAEESFDSAGSIPAPSRSSSFTWIVDPLDGTTNLVHSFPHFCVSVALEFEGVLIFGAIYAPCSGEMFTARKGRGSRLNGNEIRVSRTSELGESILATGFPYDRRTNPRNNVEYFSRLILKVQGIRRCGAAALDLAYLSCGRVDGFWELGLRPWDVAAGVLLVEEAGGRVTNMAGLPMDIHRDDILASNGLLHAAIHRELSCSGTLPDTSCLRKNGHSDSIQSVPGSDTPV